MKIAIHHRQGSFSEYWIDYCKQRGLDYKVVNAYDNDIMSQISDCDVFVWHFHHAIYKDELLAKHLLATIEMSGKKVFPDIRTNYTFDDKVAQKYLMESIGAPIIPSYVFYDKSAALKWAETTSYPKVFKLKGGAGASNVKLVKNRHSAIRLIRRAFGKGFPARSICQRSAEQLRHWRRGHISFLGLLKALISNFRPNEYARFHGQECGYVYFQDFISDNSYDIRIVVIGDRAFGIKRNCREGDFRASGSGEIEYTDLPEDMLKTAFSVANKLDLQCVALDFVRKSGIPLLVEMSFGFTALAYFKCGGYYDKELQWHQSDENQIYWILDNLLSDCNVKYSPQR